MTSDSFIVKCIHCGTKNRIPRVKMNDRPVCGRCHTPMHLDTTSGQVITVTDQNFPGIVLASPYPVLLEFWAPWCGPCGAIAPILNEMAKKYSGRMRIAKINMDQNPSTSSRFHVLSVPTLLIFKNGDVINTLVGALPGYEIENHINYTLQG